MYGEYGDTVMPIKDSIFKPLTFRWAKLCRICGKASLMFSWGISACISSLRNGLEALEIPNTKRCSGSSSKRLLVLCIAVVREEHESPCAHLTGYKKKPTETNNQKQTEKFQLGKWGCIMSLYGMWFELYCCPLALTLLVSYKGLLISSQQERL